MGKRNGVVHNPFLEEFIFDVIFNLTPAQRRNLDKKYIKAIKSPASARTFCSKSSLEEQIHFLACCGVGWTLMFHNNEMTPISLKDTLRKFKDEKVASGLHDLTTRKIYITSNKELMHLSAVMAQSIHNPQYSVNLEWAKMGYRLNQWNAWVKGGVNKDFLKSLEAIEGVDKFSQTLEHSAITNRNMEAIFGIRPIDFRLLNYLYRNRNQFVGKYVLKDYFTGEFSVRQISQSIEALRKNHYLMKSAAVNRKEYTITGIGIDLVQKVFLHIFKANNF